MTLPSGARLGPYEILSALGAGGMGEVYKAKDTRLERVVAVKILSGHLPQSHETRQRFEREAKTISQLSHPHICSLYDVGNQDGVEYLVMEYLEGETLADRLARGPLPLEQAIRFGFEIADALGRAHRQGIVHRDLKPGNVMLTRSGVKLLDFGLAKAVASGGPPSGLTALPTVAGRPNLTQEGTILGTLQYMAPEQLEGRESDGRADIFALGAVLYEMATGQKAFMGSSQASLTSAILRDEPKPISQAQPMTPPALDHVVKTCLAKDPEDRWQSAHDVASELKWIAEEGSQAGVPAPVLSRRKSRERVAWIAAAVFLVAAAVFALLFARVRQEKPHPSPLHALIPVPEKAPFDTVAVPELSPDGKSIVWSGSDAGSLQTTSPLWVRSLSSDDAHPLAGTERAKYAFWSPDSRSLGFFADYKLKRVDLAGGVPVTLCDIADVGRGGAWSPEGVIIFSGARAGPLYRISATGGSPEPLTKLDSKRGDTTHRWPQFLPDGRHFLYLASPNVSQKRAVFVASLDGHENRPLPLAPDLPLPASESGHPSRTEAIANAAYASGHILFVQKSTLYARPFDAAKAEVKGPAVVVAENVGSGYSVIRSMFSVSQNDELIYVEEPSDFDSRVEWIDRQGRLSPALSESAIYSDVQFSPNGKQLALSIEDRRTRQTDIWTIDLTRDVRTRLTFGPGQSASPVWSPDASRVIYDASRSKIGIFEKASSGVGPEKVLIETEGEATPTSWSSDGRFVLYGFWNRTEGTNYDVWVLPVSPLGKPFPYLRGTADEAEACFSPDGKHVSYSSTESGRPEIYVQSFPAGAGKWQISTQGGSSPRWRKDGRELFFLGDDGRIYAVPVRGDESFEAGTPRPAFESGVKVSGYDVAPDGQRFLKWTPVVDQAHLPQRLVVHWPAFIKR